MCVVLAIDRISDDQPPGFRMLALIGGLFLAMKAVVSVEASEAGRLPLARWLGFALLWPGMRPGLFEKRGPPLEASALLARGAVRCAVGALLIVASRLVWSASGSRLPSTLLLPGLSLLLHFGAFNLIAGLWRLAGMDCGALFRAPLRAISLREFWGRRWNLAFSEMTALGVYRPFAAVAGTRAALLAAFLVSGVFHEVAISLPVRSGFGSPLLYFALQGLLVLVEREWRPDAGFGRIATLCSLAVPLPLLFHAPFLRGVLWPLLE